MECKFININGEEIFYREMGSGPVLLLIHGNISSSIFFTEAMEELSKEYRVIAPDLRGYGNSSYNKKIHSIFEFAEDLKQFVLEMDLREFYVLGWSLGGGIVMEFLADRELKFRVKKAILMASIGIYGAELPVTTGMNGIRTQMFNINFTLTQNLVKYNPVTAFLEHSNEEIKYCGMDGVLKNLVYTNKLPEPEIYERNLKDIVKQRCLSEAGNTVASFRFNKEIGENVPILIIHGTSDKVIDSLIARVNKNYFSTQAELVMFEDCGHAVMTDKYEELIKEIRCFCK